METVSKMITIWLETSRFKSWMTTTKPAETTWTAFSKNRNAKSRPATPISISTGRLADAVPDSAESVTKFASLDSKFIPKIAHVSRSSNARLCPASSQMFFLPKLVLANQFSVPRAATWLAIMEQCSSRPASAFPGSPFKTSWRCSTFQGSTTHVRTRFVPSTSIWTPTLANVSENSKSPAWSSADRPKWSSLGPVTAFRGPVVLLPFASEFGIFPCGVGLGVFISTL